jgi:hypothetical protein
MEVANGPAGSLSALQVLQVAGEAEGGKPMNIPAKVLTELEIKISVAHEQAVSARDEAQRAIERISQIREYVTKMQTDAIKAELAEVRK